MLYRASAPFDYHSLDTYLKYGVVSPTYKPPKPSIHGSESQKSSKPATSVAHITSETAEVVKSNNRTTVLSDLLDKTEDSGRVHPNAVKAQTVLSLPLVVLVQIKFDFR